MERVAALLTLVLLLGRAGFASEIRFAIIGDYGTDNAPARTVATLVSNLQPAFIVTLGDNNYGGPGDYDRMVGKYFARYLGNYTGAYGPGGATNEFFAAIGNHDYFSPEVIPLTRITSLFPATNGITTCGAGRSTFSF